MTSAPRACCAAVLVLMLLGSAACGDDEQPVPTADCGFVAFTPNSDDGAFGVRATGVSCATALTVAKASRRARPAGTSSARFKAQGFDCVGTATDDELDLAGTAYRCTRGDARISFTRH